MGLQINKRFYDFDFWLLNYINSNNKRASKLFKKEKEKKNARFCFIFIKSGAVNLMTCEGEKVKVKENHIIIFKQFQKIDVEMIPNVDANIVLFSFANTLFQPCEESLLRLFNYSGNDNILDLNHQNNKDIILNILERAQQYINQNYQKGHFVSILKVLLSELCIDFDNVFPEIAKKYSKEYDAKIYDYICKNFNKHLTAEQVADTFFVSKGYINKLCKKFYGLPYKQMIIDIRMWYAKGLLEKEPEIKLKKVAELCGYKEYSAFFKAYSKTFDSPPEKDNNR